MGIVLQNGKLIDGTGKVIPDASVVIDGAVISAVGEKAEVEIPPGEHQIIDAVRHDHHARYDGPA